MTRVRQVSGGGKAVEVEPERLARWFARFAERGGGVTTTTLTATSVTVTAADGTTATVEVPFPPLTTATPTTTTTADNSAATENRAETENGAETENSPETNNSAATDRPGGEAARVPGLAVEPLVEHVTAPRTIGLLLVRLGAHSVGVAEGGEVVVSRTDRHLVHGRSAAGGWSQQRFARRRAGQARSALRAAADDAVEVLGSRLSALDGVVLGGDRRALDELREDTRLADVFALASPRVLDVGEPRRTVLDEAARRARAVEVLIR